mmetsp:Transcript_19376/g.25533  ORF Transcript_19376/g.25533 Transcript_19376/m.25533 type:complete len:111 (-) Transcript_19376:141-473(-)
MGILKHNENRRSRVAANFFEKLHHLHLSGVAPGNMTEEIYEWTYATHRALEKRFFNVTLILTCRYRETKEFSSPQSPSQWVQLRMSVDLAKVMTLSQIMEWETLYVDLAE